MITEGHTAAVVEVNCETDFVARGTDFKNLVRSISIISYVGTVIVMTEPVPVRTRFGFYKWTTFPSPSSYLLLCLFRLVEVASSTRVIMETLEEK